MQDVCSQAELSSFAHKKEWKGVEKKTREDGVLSQLVGPHAASSSPVSELCAGEGLFCCVLAGGRPGSSSSTEGRVKASGAGAKIKIQFVCHEKYSFRE